MPPTTPLRPAAPARSHTFPPIGDDPSTIGAHNRAPSRDGALPDRWAGHLVEWSGWRLSGLALIPPPELTAVCSRCADRGNSLVSVGRVWTDPSVTTVASIGAARGNRGRHPLGVITAHRCPDCPHAAAVIVTPSGQAWQLDAADYLEEERWECAL